MFMTHTVYEQASWYVHDTHHYMNRPAGMFMTHTVYEQASWYVHDTHSI